MSKAMSILGSVLFFVAAPVVVREDYRTQRLDLLRSFFAPRR